MNVNTATDVWQFCLNTNEWQLLQSIWPLVYDILTIQILS